MARPSTVAAAAIANISDNRNCGSLIRSLMASNIVVGLHMSKLIIFFIVRIPKSIQTRQPNTIMRPVGLVNKSEI